MNSRRSILKGLASAPVALALPATVAFAASTSTPSPDAALIAQAAAVEALAVRADAALQRICRLQGRLDDLKPDRPELSVSAYSRPEFENDPDGNYMTIRFKPIDPATALADKLAKQDHEIALAAWKAEKDRISRRIGLRAANRQRDRYTARLRAATFNLTPMVPTTIAGLAAKARAAIALDAGAEDCPHAWEHAIIAAVLRDAVAIGGVP